MNTTTSCSSNSPVSVSSTTPHSKAYCWSFARKIRLIEASDRLAFLLKVLDPQGDGCKGESSTHLSDDALSGLHSILGCVKFALTENKDAFCSCYEEQQERDTDEGLPISIHSGSIVTTDELMALAEKNSTGPGRPVEEWADELPEMLQFILELIISEFDYEKNSQSNIATACRCLAAMCVEDDHAGNS